MTELPSLRQDDYDALADAISSTESPVGIDAKKTHVYILHLLLDLQKRIARIEADLERQSTSAQHSQRK